MKDPLLLPHFSFLLVLLTTGASGEHPAEQVRGNLDGQRVRVNLPPTTEPKGVAIFFHGQGSNYNHKMDGTWLDALRRDGWVVASSMFFLIESAAVEDYWKTFMNVYALAILLVAVYYFDCVRFASLSTLCSSSTITLTGRSQSRFTWVSYLIFCVLFSF